VSVDLSVIEHCFGGGIPAVLATAAADGTPNITYISRAHRMGDDRLALSNQFMSKTARNLAANPRASLLLIDPLTHDEYRLAMVYERTERHGRVFERLRADVDALAEMQGMHGVFRLRSADVFRVVEITLVEPHRSSVTIERPTPKASLHAVSELCARVARAGDLDVLVDTLLDGLGQLLGHRHVVLWLLDETGTSLYSVAARGYTGDAVGAEVALGDGMIGQAAQRCEPMRIGNLHQMAKYARSIAERIDDAGGVRPGRTVTPPTTPDVESRMVVPLVALGALVGTLVVESADVVAYGDEDEHALVAVAASFAGALAHARLIDRDDAAPEITPAAISAAAPADAAAERVLRFFDVDGSVFLDGDYLIKGVAGRVLWRLAQQHVADGRTEFTNKELRLDPTLDLPGFKDNLESRLILLQRRLDERAAPMQIVKTGRGRFRFDVAVALRLVDGVSGSAVAASP
jgi:adenylate cyclase